MKRDALIVGRNAPELRAAVATLFRGLHPKRLTDLAEQLEAVTGDASESLAFSCVATDFLLPNYWLEVTPRIGKSRGKTFFMAFAGTDGPCVRGLLQRQVADRESCGRRGCDARESHMAVVTGSHGDISGRNSADAEDSRSGQDDMVAEDKLIIGEFQERASKCNLKFAICSLEQGTPSEKCARLSTAISACTHAVITPCHSAAAVVRPPADGGAATLRLMDIQPFALPADAPCVLQAFWNVMRLVYLIELASA